MPEACALVLSSLASGLPHGFHHRDRYTRSHHGNEVFEKIIAVMRAGRRFGMILNAEDGEIPVAEAFVRAIIEVHMCNLGALQVKGLRIDGEAMVL